MPHKTPPPQHINLEMLHRQADEPTKHLINLAVDEYNRQVQETNQAGKADQNQK